ncbi:hypothetical protein [Flavobacterium sp. FlaQc-47]|jgi:hypothetical protein|uniref:hypothetical protein n=1 Tax=Flavobacterium sp. FlaQc-47 TaxID=3374180 RepID=UPI003757338F
MANFKRSDLKLTYSWTASAENDNARITGVPDSTLLDRHEGYEVLPFLNRYLNNSTSVSTLNRLEDVLRDELPGSTRSHANVKKWLDDNFDL